MKKLLYIKHAFHNKTKSNDFLINLLSETYETEIFDFNPETDSFEKFMVLNGRKFDTVVLFQIMPSIKALKKIIHFKHIAFFPMFDAVNSVKKPLWNEYRECNIINFSRTLHNKCQEKGLSSYYIQYFPEPGQIIDYGDENSVFFWQRRENITTGILEKLLDINRIKRLYLHNVPDPGNKFIQPSEKWKNKIEYSNWFDSKEKMLEYMQQAAIYFAPRSSEGIGMSFLDAMASGRCVIAPDYPTMNEYIKHNFNGYLYNLKAPHKINIKNIRTIQQNTINFIKNGYKKWNTEKYNILNWIETPVNTDNKVADDTLLTKIRKYYLFGFIPLLRCNETTNYVSYKLFHVIPISKTKNKHQQIHLPKLPIKVKTIQ